MSRYIMGIDASAQGLAQTSKAIIPDPSLKACYDEAYGRYLGLYDALKPYFALQQQSIPKV